MQWTAIRATLADIQLGRGFVRVNRRRFLQRGVQKCKSVPKDVVVSTGLPLAWFIIHGVLVQVALAEGFGKRAGTLREEQTRLKEELQNVDGRIQKAKKDGETVKHVHSGGNKNLNEYCKMPQKSREARHSARFPSGVSFLRFHLPSRPPPVAMLRTSAISSVQHEPCFRRSLAKGR